MSAIHSAPSGPVVIVVGRNQLSLDARNSDFCSSGARWLVNAPLVDTLRRLNVNHNSFGPDGLYGLLEKKPPFLHTLEMVDNDVDWRNLDTIEELGDAPLLEREIIGEYFDACADQRPKLRGLC